jgi:hypothetical protein|tara:strand:+ start:307 stop:591 length:285 start_codon:yes stop_codon:yes gene_type:complete
MSLDKFDIQDIWHILQPQAINQEKTNKLLERIAVALERANSLEHILTEDEKEFLCGCKKKKKKIAKKRKPRRSKGEIKGEITRKYIKKLNKEKK